MQVVATIPHLRRQVTKQVLRLCGVDQLLRIIVGCR